MKKKTRARKFDKRRPLERYSAKQIDFALRYYLPSSPTYDNALQSALAAGYSESYARTITTNFDLPWLKNIVYEIVGKSTDKKNMVEKAKRVLNKSLDSVDEKIAQDTAKFIAKTTAEFSEKTDITSDGKSVAPIALVEFADGSTKNKGSATD